MPLTEIALRVKREGGVGESLAVEHADLVPGLVRVRHNFPVQCLVNDKVLSLRNRNARRADDLAAGTGQNEVPAHTEDLLGKLTPLIDALLERLAFPHRFEPLVDRGEPPCGLGKALPADFGLVENAPRSARRTQRRQSQRRAMDTEHKRKQVF